MTEIVKRLRLGAELYKAANALLNSIHCDEEIDREKALRCGDYAVAAAGRIGRLEEALLKLSTVRYSVTLDELLESRRARGEVIKQQHTRGLELAKALSTCITAMNPPDRNGISMHEWNQRLKAATKQACAVLDGSLKEAPADDG